MPLLVYVDDIIITSPNVHAIDSSKEFLHAQFKLKGSRAFEIFSGD